MGELEPPIVLPIEMQIGSARVSGLKLRRFAPIESEALRIRAIARKLDQIDKVCALRATLDLERLEIVSRQFDHNLTVDAMNAVFFDRDTRIDMIFEATREYHKTMNRDGLAALLGDRVDYWFDAWQLASRPISAKAAEETEGEKEAANFTSATAPPTDASSPPS